MRIPTRVDFRLSSAVFFLLATGVLTWPLAVSSGAQFSSRQDFYLGVWNLWWVARALTEPGVDLLRTELLYFPLGAGLEVQPLSLLQTAAAVPLTASLGPVRTFNLLVLLSFWLAGWLASLWVQRLAGDPVAGLAAGLLFAFAPYHYTYLAQLNLVAVWVVPLYFLAADGLRRRPSLRRAALAGSALAAVGLTSWYYGVAVGLVAALLSVERLLRSPLRGAPRVGVEAAHWATCAVLLAPLVIALLPAFAGRPLGGEVRGMALVMERFKATPLSFGIWSYAGLSALALAALGLRPLRRSGALLALVASFVLLSLGDTLRVGDVAIPLPYGWLQALPVVGALRYPDRFFVVAQLGLAALAGLGVTRLRSGISARGTRVLAAGSVALLVVPAAELWPGPLVSVPPPEPIPVPPAAREPRGALLHIPAFFRSLDGDMMFHQVRHGRPIVGGYLTRPDGAALRRLRADPDLGPLLAPTPPSRLPRDLGRQLRRRGFAYVYVQRRPTVRGEPIAAGSVFGPFSLSAPAYLRQRLFPDYAAQRTLGESAGRWEALLHDALGPPVAEHAQGALFRLPGSA